MHLLRKPTHLSDVIAAVEAGKRLCRDDARVLYEEAPLSELGRLSALIRQRLLPGKQVTFLIDRNINYTNVCNTDCSFCGFYRHNPRDPESYVLSRAVIGKKIEEALALGATRILLQGGHNDELPYTYYVELIEWLHNTFPIELNAFSPSEVQQMARISGKSYFEILSELKSVGLAGLPGGGGEILDDEVRRRVSPKKIKADEWIEVMRVAHGLDLTTTATMVIGFGETIEQRLNHFDRVRNLQEETHARGLRGFNGFISWPLQSNENTSLGRSRKSATYGAGTDEYLRNATLARIYLQTIPHHQSSWPTMGGEVAQRGLTYGLDDIGSTMMEENVVSQAGGKSKEKWAMSPEELCGMITAAGFTPAQRNSRYETLHVLEKSLTR
jgi:cyclic dehypoxanthinyl futalosine synthase